jgi:hypothetical protein
MQAQQQHHGDGADRNRHEGKHQDFGHRQPLITLDMARPSPNFQFSAAIKSAAFEMTTDPPGISASLAARTQMPVYVAGLRS